MNDRSLCYSLVDDKVGDILAHIHAGHVDHDLRVGGVVPGVQHADITIHQGSHSNITNKFV